MQKTANKKPVIAVDIDDVIAAERDAVRLFHNQKYGTTHTIEDYSVGGSYWGYWEQIWGVDGEEGKRRFESYLNSGSHAGHLVLDGAIEVLGKLKEHFELVVITSRNDRLIEISHEWLEVHFPGVFKSVEFVAVWSKDEKVSKATICTKIGASYLIDDSAEHCNLAAKSGINALLYGDYGWNRKEVLMPEVTRVKDWQEIARYFDGRS